MGVDRVSVIGVSRFTTLQTGVLITVRAMRATASRPYGWSSHSFVATVLRQRRAWLLMILGDACISWRLALSLTVPNEHAENTGTRKRRYPEEPPALDSLENAIRKERSLADRVASSGPTRR
jgi:hypothetical protein